MASREKTGSIKSVYEQVSDVGLPCQIMFTTGQRPLEGRLDLGVLRFDIVEGISEFLVWLSRKQTERKD
jgi:hypothetical protein